MQDDRVNGVCGVSRLLGCYYLYPQVIPLPSTKSVTLPPYTNFLIIGTHGLWKYMTQKEIYKCIRSFRDPDICSKRLADLAVASGCPLDVSVIVAKIVLGEDLADSKNVIPTLDLESSFQIIEEDEEEDEGLEDDVNTMTNIDDILEDSFTDNIAPVADQSYLESEGLHVISPDQLDALVNKDMMVEDLHVGDEVLSKEDDRELIREGSYIDIHDDDDDENISNLRDSVLSGKIEDYNLVMSMERNLTAEQEDDDDDGSGDSVRSEESDDSKNDDVGHQKKMSKSVPEIKAEFELQIKEDSEVNPMLKNINVAISNVAIEEEIFPEEEEEMRKGGNVKRKKSFVQSSYDRLSRHAFDTGTSFHSL